MKSIIDIMEDPDDVYSWKWVDDYTDYGLTTHQIWTSVSLKRGPRALIAGDSESDAVPTAMETNWVCLYDSCFPRSRLKC